MKIPAFLQAYLHAIWVAAKGERKRAIVRALGRAPQSVLLDCGCGDGGWTSTLVGPVQPRLVIGMDVLPGSLKNLVRSNGGIRSVCAELNHPFPIRDGIIDVVVSDQVIEHLIDLDMFVSEIYRILRPGGVAVISTENLAAAHNILALLLGVQPSTGPHLSTRVAIGCHPVVNDLDAHYQRHPAIEQMPPHTKVIAYRSLAALFRAHGFHVHSLWGTGFFPFPHGLARCLARCLPWYAAFVTVKAVKPTGAPGNRVA